MRSLHPRQLVVPLLAAAATLAGCRHDDTGGGGGGRTPYTGPTDPMAVVVANINARNERLPHFWARHNFEATIVDDKKQSHFVNGDGALLYRRPRSMLLAAKRPGLDRVFEIGSTDENY